ncbi:hypothetical protein AVEN_15677-1 [Araneus ventricosus]|uniref:Uncharacterized protein n=1 Tax=Araneus ventricosus TaxID=182803 RepID=A0A4Y2M5D0_ARAVE|nr:hypothetical protein AVEN_15677-1 [Araneus ventricosus]
MRIKFCSHGVWLGKPRVARGSYLWTVELRSLGSARVNGCSLDTSPPLTCELLTAITREITDDLQAYEPHRFFLFRRREIKALFARRMA